MADFWTAYETSRSGKRSGTIDRKFRGERICCILNSQESAFAPYYDTGIGATGWWPGASGALGAQLHDYILEPFEGRPGCKKLTLLYQELEPHQALQPGRAVLRVKLASHAAKMKTEPGAGGAIIEGPDPNNPLAEWKIVKGSNVQLQPGCELVVDTVVESLNLAGLWSRLGKSNDAQLPNFGGATKNSMKLTGMTHTGLVQQQGWRHISYHFDYCGEKGGWPLADPLTVTRFLKRPVSVRAVNTAGAEIVDAWHTIIGLIPDPAAANLPRDLSLGECSFSDLNGMLEWY
jgi:hypothetical protein